MSREADGPSIVPTTYAGNIFDVRHQSLVFICGSSGSACSTLVTPGGSVASVLKPDKSIVADLSYGCIETNTGSWVERKILDPVPPTRDLADAAVACVGAIVVIDASLGLTLDIRQKCGILHLYGVRDFVVVVSYPHGDGLAQAHFRDLEKQASDFMDLLGSVRVYSVPLGATGDRIAFSGSAPAWHRGATLEECLRRLCQRAAAVRAKGPLRMLVQQAAPSSSDSHEVRAALVNGVLEVGNSIVMLPSRRQSNVARFAAARDETVHAQVGSDVAVVLTDDLHIGTDAVIASEAAQPEVSDQVAAHILWLGSQPMLPGRSYAMRCAYQGACATITALRYKLDVARAEKVTAEKLEQGEIAYCHVAFSKPLVFDPYDEVKELGYFTLMDKQTAERVGTGFVRFGLRRAQNLRWQTLTLDKTARANALRQNPLCIWLTGLSGSGKSTIANLLEQRLHSLGRHTYVLDGDNVRHGLNRDLGFTDADRVENIRRVAEVAKLMVDAGLITIAAFISPFKSERLMVRDLFAPDEFLEVYVDAALEVCEQRDPKGLYRKARAGQLKNFTGIDSAYEPPEHPDVRLETTSATAEELVERLLVRLGLASNW